MNRIKAIEPMELPHLYLNLLYMARDKRDKGMADDLIKAHTAAFEAAFHLSGRGVTLSFRERANDAFGEAMHYIDCAMQDLDEDDRMKLKRIADDLEVHSGSNRNAMDHVRDDGLEPYEAEKEDE